MLNAAELLPGMTLRINGEIFRVLELESKAGAAKMGGVVKTKLINVRSGRMWEPHFRPNERLETVEVERRLMEFLFSEGDTCTFMRPDTFEQLEVPRAIVGAGAGFLQPSMEVLMDFFQGEPIGALLPDVMEARVARTTPASHAAQDSAWKEATLENGLPIHVPMFVGPGETIRVDVKTGHYVERVRLDKKHVA